MEIENKSVVEKGKKNPSLNINIPDSVDIKRISSMISTVSEVPTHIPTKLIDQLLIYINGSTYRIYVYDNINSVWRYVNLT